MKLPLETVADDGEVAVLGARDVPAEAPQALRYRTRTGALLRIGGIVRGAFDRKHETLVVPAGAAGPLTLEVERSALPATGLPAGDGLRWRWLLARARERPAASLETCRSPRWGARLRIRGAALACVGHSHLDVAWLWTYEQAARKALRTFATAVQQLESDPAFVYTQSQPQLYEFVAERDGAFFERIRSLSRASRIDTSGAAMWVEADCNLPSGESLLRQLSTGMRYVEREFGTLPSVAWLPDTFGFPNTLPTLLAHAGIEAFATTKLGWNDTTVFPYARFRWEGPDGSRVLAAQIASLEGGFEPRRVRLSRRRGDLLLIGYGDGGGGAPDAALGTAPAQALWTTLADWFTEFRTHADELPVVRDELYLEQHRGTLTSHHDVKARNARLERALGETERLLAWALALHASPFFLQEAQRQLAAAWKIVLRAQFHDVLPGSAIPEVYAAVHEEYAEAEALVAGVAANARSVLPQAPLRARRAQAPVEVRDGFEFAGESLFARVRRDGTLAELRAAGGRNLVRRANRLALYVDRPRHWDAWNVDRGYRKRERRMRVTGFEIVEDELEIRYAFGASVAVTRISLVETEPFLRVDIAVDWHERHALLRCENELSFAASRARFGSPHGYVERPPAPRSAAERAKFEAPGQRFARADGAAGDLAVLALDTYGWSISRRRGVTLLGHSLLRGPTWPDPAADAGEHAFSLAYVPCTNLGTAALERLWERFAAAGDVPMFVSETAPLLVVATKPADDGKGVVVRLRECEGRPVQSVIRCGARARSAACCDALERPVAGDVTLHEGALHAAFRPFEVRSFRVLLA